MGVQSQLTHSYFLGEDTAERQVSSRVCVCSTGRVLVSVHFPSVKTVRLPRGSRPQVQSLRGERVEASSTIPPTGHPATQKIFLTDCDS